MNLLSYAFGIVPAAVLLVAAILMRTGILRPRVGDTSLQAVPVQGATVIGDALLLDADRRVAAAVLIDLAVRGKILLRTGSSRAPVGVEIVKGADFTSEELAILGALFGPSHVPGKVRRFSSDGRALRRKMGDALRAAEAKLIEAGLISPQRLVWPVVVVRVLSGILLVASVVLFAMALAAGDSAGVTRAIIVFIVVIAALIVIPPPQRVFLPAAEPLRAHLAGLRAHMAVHGSAPAAGMKQLLPYAVLFGLEQHWTAVLKTESEARVRAGDVVEAVEDTLVVLEVARVIGGTLQVASSVGELVDATGRTVELVGGVFEAVS